MSIADEVARLQQAKQDIKNSIENKGVEIGSDVKLDLYSTFIDNISSGDGDNEDLAQHLWNAITKGATNCDYLFMNYNQIVTLNISGVDTSRITTSFRMFYGCTQLTTILGKLDLSNTQYLKQIFYNCPSLTEVHLTNICKNTISNSANYDLDLSSTKINTECLLEIINELPDTSSMGFSRTLTLPSSNTLTEEQVQVAIDKGWNVANIKY